MVEAVGTGAAPSRQGAVRKVVILACCQALFMTGNTMMITLSSLAAADMLREDKALATLPVTAMVVGTLITTIPASLWMKRVGRRLGFVSGAVIGIFGGIVSTLGIALDHFVLFCFGTLLMGCYNAFCQYYRFAAAEVSNEAYKSRAISYVLAGGVIAAFLGPELAKQTREVIPAVTYLGSYLSLIVLSLLALVLSLRVEFPPVSRSEQTATGRPLLEIMRQPRFLVAVFSALVGYASMSLVMTATPLAMALCALPFSDTAFVIQWHALGMFAPAFFTGSLIKRFGVLPIILCGIAIEIVAVLVSLNGITLAHFWIGLFLLGLGWNFMFVGGTTLLTETYTHAEKSKAQAMNDFLLFGSVAMASFLSGNVLHFAGWTAVNALALPFLLAVLLAASWLFLVRRRGQAAA